jgi:Uma2 family endonuclease
LTISENEHFPQFTPLEYLEWEAQQELRHEFVNGRISAMTSDSIEHDAARTLRERITANFSTMLQNHLQSSVCRVFGANIKVQILESNSFLYPDVSVSGDVQDRSASNFITHPYLIVEVLSPSTEADNRGYRFASYRQVTSLQDYVLVSTDSIGLDVYRLNEGGEWELSSYQSGAVVELNSVNFTFEIDRIYEDL